MPAQDKTNNRIEKSITLLSRILGPGKPAWIAVDYLFISGLMNVTRRLLNLKEVRLLIVNTTNRCSNWGMPV